MAQFFALLLAIIQAPPAPRAAGVARRALGGRVRDAARGHARIRRDHGVCAAQGRPARGGRSRSRHDSLAVGRRDRVHSGDRRRPGVHGQRADDRSARRRNRRDEMANAAARRRRGTAVLGHRAGCWPRRPPAISLRSARRTARWCGGGSSARRSSRAPGPALDRLFLPLADNRVVARAAGERRDRVGAQASRRRSPRSSRSRISSCSARPRRKSMSIDLERGRDRWTWTTRRRHGRQPGRRRQADLLRLARQHLPRGRSQERQLAVESRTCRRGRPAGRCGSTTCC